MLAALAACLAFLLLTLHVRETRFKRGTARQLARISGRRGGAPARTGWDFWQRRLSAWRQTQTAAALQLRMEEYWALVLGVTLLSGLAGGVLRGWPGAILLAGGGFAAVSFWLRVRRQRWLDKAETQLPDFLRGIGTTMRAGGSFAQALSSVGSETADPLGSEVRRIARREALGFSLDQALSELALRVPSKDLELAIAAIQVQREVGGALAPLLDSIVDTIMARQRLKAEVRTLTASGRASGMILTVMPIGLSVLIWFMNPTYMAPLFTTSMGHYMLGYGVVSLVIGSVVINRMVRGPEL